jgi:hypothetical protein
MTEDEFEAKEKSDLIFLQNMMFSNTELQKIPIMTIAEGKEAEATEKGVAPGSLYLRSDDLLIRLFINGIWNNWGKPGEYVREENGHYYWK